MVGIVCRHNLSNVAVRWPIHLDLLGRRPSLKMVTMLKETCSGWFMDVSGNVSTLKVG